MSKDVEINPLHACFRFHEALLFPLNDIFPKIFFLEKLNEQWMEIFHELYSEEHIARWEENLGQKKLEILMKSSIDYLEHTEREAIFVFSLRNFFIDIHHNQIGLKQIVSQCRKLLQLAQHWENTSSEKSPIRSLGQSYLLFILTLNNSIYSPAHQRKVLELAYSYGQKALLETQKNNNNETQQKHPYFNLLFSIIHVASGNWDGATKELHSLSIKYPDPKLYQVLVKLYIKIELPNVAHYFAQKLEKNQFVAESLTLNSDLRAFSNCA